MKMPEPVAWRYETPTGWHATADAGKAHRVDAHHKTHPLYDKQALIDLLEEAANLSERLWPDEKRSGHEWTDGFADGTCGAADAIRKLKETL
jgi:hypothetical protein